MNRFAGLNLLGPYLRPLSRPGGAGAAVAAGRGRHGAGLRRLPAGPDRPGFAQGRPDVLNYALASLLVVAVVLAIASGARFYLVSWLGERVVGDLRRDLFAHVVRLGPAWFEIKRSGDVMSRISSDAQLIEQVIGSSASVALRNTLMCVGGIVMLVITNPKLALLVLAVVPVVVAPIIIFGRKVRALSREAQARVADMVSEGGETLDAVRTVQAFAQEDRADQALRRGDRTGLRRRHPPHQPARHHDHPGDLHRLRRRRLPAVDGRPRRDRRPHQRRRPLGLRVLCRAGGELGRRDQRDDRRPAARRRAPPSAWPSCAPSSRSSSRPPIPSRCPSRCRAPSRFEEVSFRYPTRPDSLALDRFDLSVAPGETVAIVGPSGAGKTTVFSLLLRFYDPEAGTIRVDGVDIRDLRLADLRGALAIVPQEPVLFTATVADNIRYGRPDATDAEVRAAAEAASALGFIEALPQGFATHLGARGVRLSGGQRQRIAIARALLCDPAILLLDEATSALDAESELAVQQALDRLMHKRTTLVIAHRLATVQKADRIVVIDQGRVVDVGRHADLVRRGGLYARLAELQFNLSAAAS